MCQRNEKLTESQLKNIKEKLIKFQNELIRENRIKKDNDIYNAWYYGSITYNGIKDIRYLFNEDEDIKDISYLFNEDNDVDEDKRTYKESSFKSIIQDIKDRLSKDGDKLIKNGLHYVEKLESLTSSEIKNIKEKLIKFKNERIRKNRINNKIKKDLDDYNGNTKYKAIKDIRYLFNEEDIYNGINDIKYLFNENEDYYEDKMTHKESPCKSIIEDIKRDTCYAEKIKITHKESPFKSIIEDIKRGLYYVEKINNLSTLDIKNIKEKLVKFKNELFNNDNNNYYNNNKIKKDLNECKGIKYIRYLFNEDKNKKSDLYMTEKIKNKIVSEIKIKKDFNECKGIKGIRYLFNDNIYKGIIDIRYLFNEDYYVKKLDSKNIKSEFNKRFNNLVKAHTKDISYMVDYINNGEKLKERPINLEDIRDEFIAYNDYLPFGILSNSSYIDVRKMKIVSSVTFDDEYKILKTESRIMVNSLRTLKMPLFLGFLRNLFVVHFNDNVLEEELLEYIKLNRNKVQYVWIDEFKKWLKELREVIDQENMIKKELRKEINVLKLKAEDEIDLLEWRLRMERILMKDNDKDEYFQYMELDKIK